MLTLKLLVANLVITKWCKKTKMTETLAHLRVLSRSYPMNTNMIGLDGFQRSLCPSALDKSSLSIGMVNILPARGLFDFLWMMWTGDLGGLYMEFSGTTISFCYLYMQQQRALRSERKGTAGSNYSSWLKSLSAVHYYRGSGTLYSEGDLECTRMTHTEVNPSSLIRPKASWQLW